MRFPGVSRTRVLVCLLLCTLIVPAGIIAQSADRQLYQEAENRFRSKDYELALQKYRQLIDEYQLSRYVPDAQFRRAVCLFRLGRPQEALTVFRLVESTYPSTDFLPFVPFWIGVISYNQKDYEAASRNLQRYLAGGESSLVGQAQLILAVSENELGRTEAAIGYLEAMQRDGFGDQVYAVPFLASLYVREKNYQAVIDLVADRDIEGLGESDQRRLDLYEAEAQWHLGNRAEAAQLYERLRSAGPDIASVAYQRLFAYYQELGDEEALEQIVLDAEIKLAGRPEVLAEFWLRIGIETFRDGKYDLSRSYFQRVWNLRRNAASDGLVPLYLAELDVIANRPAAAANILKSFAEVSDSRRELVLFRLGGIYLDLGRWADAGEELTTFLAEFPESRYFSEGAYLAAYAHYRNGETRRALGVIDTVLGDALGGAFTDRLLRLQSVLYKQLGELERAVDTLREYIPLRPSDSPAQMDLIKLLFRLEEYDEVIAQVETVAEIEPFNQLRTSYYLLTQYMHGLSLIARQQYADAAEVLERITADAVDEAGLSIIYPYTLFYRGWAYYRDATYERAEANFAEMVDRAPGHELASRAAYLAGWCAFAVGEYGRAEGYLVEASTTAGAELSIKADFMRAKSLAGQGEYEEAAIVFENIYLEHGRESLADDALFEYAGSLAVLDKLDDSVATYRTLYEVYPTSPLAEESMYKRGELLYEAGRYEEAREAFYEHRINFRRGSLYDASLYWGGMASAQSGEAFGAVLLWEQLIENYKDSAFRADALRRTAEVYEESGDFRKALNYYSELIAVYPEEAAAISAEERAEKLRYLILGQGEREAELSVIIGREGATTREGREAILELARIYIFKSGSKQNLAPPLLDELIAKADEDPETAAQAQYLFGEYYYRKNDLRRAANEFLAAIEINPDDRDLAAQSLYRAAEMAKLAGNLSEARELVRRIESTFPSSQWVEAGKKLIEDQ